MGAVKKRPTRKKPGRKKERRGGTRPGAGRPKKGAPILPDEIARALLAASDADELVGALRGVAHASLTPGPDGKPLMERAAGKLALELAKEVRQALKVKAMEPKPGAVAEGLEILTADEWEALERYRASKRVPPLKPGDAPPPPPEESA